MENEIWKDVVGYEGLYQVSNFGRIKSLGWDYIRSKNRRSFKPDKILKISVNSRGYQRIELNKVGKAKKFSVHRLVAIAFLDTSNLNNDVNHIDGNKLNNNALNLEWCTHAENSAHARDTGLFKPSKGQNHVRAKLTDTQVIEIREKFSTGEFKNKSKVALQYSVSSKTIVDIVNNKNWKHLIKSTIENKKNNVKY